MPTITLSNQPDLTALIESSRIVGKHIKPGAIIVYESTVFPGATEEVCIPVLQEYSSLKWKEDFGLDTVPKELIRVTRSELLPK